MPIQKYSRRDRRRSSVQRGTGPPNRRSIRTSGWRRSGSRLREAGKFLVNDVDGSDESEHAAGALEKAADIRGS